VALAAKQRAVTTLHTTMKGRAGFTCTPSEEANPCRCWRR
jgi:predicted aconitase